METVYTSRYVAQYLGVPLPTVNGWIANPPSDFPEPTVQAVGSGKRISLRGWKSSDLPDLRKWVEVKLGLVPHKATSRWNEIDKTLESDFSEKSDDLNVPLFSVEDLTEGM